ncbi:MAG TPA: hypothetical protein VIE46_01620, partial [Gemmatimonadales bacterium]
MANARPLPGSSRHSSARGAAWGVAVALALVGARAAAAQEPGVSGGGIGGLVPGIRPGQGMSIGQVGPGQPLDTATARMLGLPTAPTRTFPEADSVLTELLKRTGYKVTRYRADSATYYADDRRMRLTGAALTEREGVKLEADTVRYQETSCLLEAGGEPHLFEKSQILVGGAIEYNTCTSRG